VSDAKVSLDAGARLLGEDGYLLVTQLGRHSVVVESSTGERREVPYGEISGARVTDGQAPLAVSALEPWWSGLPEPIRREAIDKLEVVIEVLTGYRWGHQRLAQPGEPHPPFGCDDVSMHRRCVAMAKVLSFEQTTSRTVVRRLLDGEVATATVSARTIHNWIRTWRDEGLRGLVDKRATKGRQGFDALDERVRRIADDVFARFNGDDSKVNVKTIEAEIRLQMKHEGLEDVRLPQRLFQEYLSERHQALGRTTRAHRSRYLRRSASAHTSFAAMHPGHLALDATRADVLVWDEVHECPRSVEVLTVISVATRVIVALRVTPRSGNAVEAGLVLYDAMRPMSMLVDGTTVDDWRWCGVPESLDLSGVAIHRSPQRVIPPGQSLQSIQGVHYKPGVTPSSVRCDHGSVFLSEHFVGILRDLGVDLMLSRGSKPTDNPHVERWHETLQRAYQAIPGFKGRNVSERGRKVEAAGEQLLTAHELERHLRRFVALDYHRSWHQGLVLPGAEQQARLTPLEMWDAMMEVTGRIHVPQHPDLIYQFLPIRWLTIGHAGVEYKNLTYDAPVLDDFRDIRPGTFLVDSRKAPFHYDPRDVSRIWFRHPDTGRLHEIGWKARHLLDLPLSDFIRDRAIANIKARGGNRSLKADSAWRRIIDELGQLTSVEETAESRAKAYAARLRWEQAQRDHAEAAEAAELFDQSDGVVTPLRRRKPDEPMPGYDLDEEWPDYDELGGE
jgi:putative transposase